LGCGGEEGERGQGERKVGEGKGSGVSVREGARRKQVTPREIDR